MIGKRGNSYVSVEILKNSLGIRGKELEGEEIAMNNEQ
jgi:hypothetical protein